MINLIQPITIQQAYDGITHAWWWASWNWWWRKVDDDDGDDFGLSGAQNGLQICPSEEEQEVAAAPYHKTRWILLSDFFLPEREYMELELRSVESHGSHEAGGTPQGGGHTLHPCGQGVGPLWLILSPIFFIYSKNNLHEVSGHSENFICAEK